MYTNQYVIWLFVGISSVLVSQTTSQSWTNVYCGGGQSCPADSSCTVTDYGYWYCKCHPGYISVYSQCRVQCSYPNPSCPSNSVCSKIWHYCACSVGYRWRGGQCRVYCGDGQSCPTYSSCTDDDYCECDQGYVWVNSECTDLDECSSLHRCHQNAVCNNTPGSYYCTCKSGYTGNGQTCTDIDECSDIHPCHTSAVCQNYPGGYNCTCLTGYSGNGTTCTDIDECSNSSPCDKAAICENYPGGYNCTCLTGYSGNGTNCTDIDECSDRSPCDQDALCDNYPGGYNCTCLTGYSGNGTLCTSTQVAGPHALEASPGAIAGGVIGACVVLIAVVVLVFIMTRRRRKENPDVDVPKSQAQPMYENVRMSSGTTGNTAAVVSPDVDGSPAELYHNNLIKEDKKMQLDQRSEKLDDNLDINDTNDTIYYDDHTGEFGGSHYDKLWKMKQPSPNFTKERSNGDDQVNLTADVQISKGAEVYGYDHLKRGASQPGDNTGHDQEGEAYGHLYGADVNNWDTENTYIDDEQLKTNNVYSLAKDVDRD